MAKQTDPAHARTATNECLAGLADKLRTARARRDGDIVFRLSGEAAGNFSLRCDGDTVELVEPTAAGTDRAALVEVIGDADVVRSILAGEKDARKQFLAGRFRLRGDLRYASDLAVQLGILSQPL